MRFCPRHSTPESMRSCPECRAAATRRTSSSQAAGHRAHDVVLRKRQWHEQRVPLCLLRQSSAEDHHLVTRKDASQGTADAHLQPQHLRAEDAVRPKPICFPHPVKVNAILSKPNNTVSGRGECHDIFSGDPGREGFVLSACACSSEVTVTSSSPTSNPVYPPGHRVRVFVP